MSKQKLVFRVGTGLAVTGLALSMGTGCPKGDSPTVNPVPAANNQQPEQPTPPPEQINVNTVASPPEPEVDPRALPADAGSDDPSPKMKEPIRVNTPPPAKDPVGEPAPK